MAADIKVEVRYDAVQVLIDGVLHLHVIRSKLLGVQSWVREAEGAYVIEFAMQGGSMESDYDTKEKWLAVLAGLSKALV